MKCIFCLKEKNIDQFNIEHVFPESIGGKLTINNVCIGCNSDLGAYVDSHLVNHWAIINKCHHYSIRNRDGIVPNPFANTSQFSGTEEKVNYNFNKDGKPIGLYRIPYRNLDEKTGQLHVKVDAKDKRNLVEIVNKITDRKGLQRLSEDEIEKNSYEGKIEKPTITYQATFDIYKYMKGIVKIAYELSCNWLGDDYLYDNYGIIIRNYLLDRKLFKDFSKKYPMRGTIGLKEENSPGDIFDYEPFYHLGYLYKNNNEIIAYIRVFDTFDCIMKMSTNANRYTFNRQITAIDPVKGNIYNEIKYKVINS